MTGLFCLVIGCDVVRSSRPHFSLFQGLLIRGARGVATNKVMSIAGDGLT